MEETELNEGTVIEVRTDLLGTLPDYIEADENVGAVTEADTASPQDTDFEDIEMLNVGAVTEPDTSGLQDIGFKDKEMLNVGAVTEPDTSSLQDIGFEDKEMLNVRAVTEPDSASLQDIGFEDREMLNVGAVTEPNTSILQHIGFKNTEMLNVGAVTEPESANPQDCVYREILQIKVIVLIFGLSSLLPWNVVINAAGYFKKKLEGDPLQHTFALYLQVAAVFGNLLGSFAMGFFNRVSNPRTLALISNFFFISPMIVLTVMTKVNCDSWKANFFIINIVAYSVTAVSFGVLSSSQLMLCSMIRPDVVKSLYIGKGVAGITGSFLTIATLAFPKVDVVAAAFYYFLIVTVFILFGTTPLLFYFLDLRFVRQRTILQKKGKVENEEDESTTLTLLDLLKKIKSPCITVVLITLVTLIVFPATLTNLKPVSSATGNPWTDKFFLPVTVFLVWAFADLAGKLLSEFVSWPKKEHILWFAIMRIIVIPLILMTNIQPRTLPVWFHSDVVPSLLAFFTSFTGGHLFNLCIAYAPLYVEGRKNVGRASMVTFFFSAVGLALGSACIFVVPPILNAG